MKLFVVLAVLLLSTACGSTETVLSSEVDQNLVHQRYRVTYSASTDQTEIFVQLREGGSLGPTIELVPPSEVRHEDTLLDLESTAPLGSFYSKFFEGYQKEHNFLYLNDDGDSFENIVSMNSIEPPDLDEPVSKSEPWEFVWVGKEVQEGEIIQVILNDSENKLVLKATESVGSTSIEFAQTDLLKLKSGVVQVELERRRQSSLDEATSAGGLTIAIYRSVAEILLN